MLGLPSMDREPSARTGGGRRCRRRGWGDGWFPGVDVKCTLHRRACGPRNKHRRGRRVGTKHRSGCVLCSTTLRRGASHPRRGSYGRSRVWCDQLLRPRGYRRRAYREPVVADEQSRQGPGRAQYVEAHRQGHGGCVRAGVRIGRATVDVLGSDVASRGRARYWPNMGTELSRASGISPRRPICSPHGAVRGVRSWVDCVDSDRGARGPVRAKARLVSERGGRPDRELPRRMLIDADGTPRPSNRSSRGIRARIGGLRRGQSVGTVLL